MKITMLPMAIALSICASAVADTPGTPIKVIKPRELSCQEFLSFDEVTRPQILYFSQGMTTNGKSGKSVMYIDQVNNLVPVIVEECTKDPRGSYWQKVKADFRRMF